MNKLLGKDSWSFSFMTARGHTRVRSPVFHNDLNIILTLSDSFGKFEDIKATIDFTATRGYDEMV